MIITIVIAVVSFFAGYCTCGLLTYNNQQQGGKMNWREFTEKYGEYPEDHYDDPADFQEAIGNKAEANRIRKERKEENERTRETTGDQGA